MKKMKLLKSILTISSLSIVTPIIYTLSSCNSTDDSKPVDPTPTKTLIKLNTNIAPRDINNAIEDVLPLTITSSSSYALPCKVNKPSALSNVTFQYRIAYVGSSNWSDWTTIENGETRLMIQPTEIYQFRAYSDTIGSFSTKTDQININFSFDSQEQCVAEHGIFIKGSLASLLCKTPEDPTSKTETLQATDSLKTNYCFKNLFNGSWTLDGVSSYLLPFKTITENCYESMFEDCAFLTTAPHLPATSLKTGCYNTMFRDCILLPNAPHLPATTLIDNCYANMFDGCATLRSASIAYVGNFKSTYFKNWLGGTLQHGVLFYNGCDTEKESYAIPRNFEVVQDTKYIEEKTVTFTLKSDNSSSTIKNKRNVRFYKENKIDPTLADLRETHVATDSRDIFDHYVDTKGNSVSTKTVTTAEQLYNITLNKDGVLIPKYGFYPITITNYCNAVFEKEAMITVTTSSTIQYSYVDLDHPEAEDWKTFTSGTPVKFRDKTQYRFRGNIQSQDETKYTNIKIVPVKATDIGSVKIYGTVMSLLRKKLTDANPTTLPCDFACYNMFKDSTSIATVDLNFLPATTLTKMCYANMFSGCSYMTQAPKFPTIEQTVEGKKVVSCIPTTAPGCCYQMFSGCSSITEFGEIPADSKIADPYGTLGTFEGMFKNCSKLKTVAPINGIKQAAAPRCAFYSMFAGCSSLLKAPNMDISAVTWEDSKNTKSPFANMFDGCENMTVASNVKIICNTVGYYGFFATFRNCYLLTQKELPTFSQNISHVGEFGMSRMFYNCRLITEPPFQGKSLWDKDAHVNQHSLSYMFSGCTSLRKGFIIRSNGYTGAKNQYNYQYAYMYENCSSLKVKRGSSNWATDMPGSDNWFFKACNWSDDCTFCEGMFNGCKSDGFTGTPSSGGTSGVPYPPFVLGGRYSYGWVDY